MDSGKIALEISLENRAYLSKLAESKKATESFGGSMGALGKLGVGAAMLSIAGGIFKVAEAAIKGAAQMEQYETSFTVMLGSADKARKVLAEIRDFGARTPFEFPGLVEVGQKLLAFGVDAKDLIPTLTNLGNASQGNSEKLETLADAYGKVRASGRASMEDINRFTDAGVGLTSELARVMGVSDQAVRKLVEDGKVGFKQLDAAIFNLTNTGGKFAGMMEQQSKTLIGMYSNLKDNITSILTDVGNKMSPAMKEAVRALQDTTTEGGIAKSALEGIGDAVTRVVQIFTVGVRSIQLFFDTIKIKILELKEMKDLTLFDIPGIMNARTLVDGIKKMTEETADAQVKSAEEIEAMEARKNARQSESINNEKEIEKLKKKQAEGEKEVERAILAIINGETQIIKAIQEQNKAKLEGSNIKTASVIDATAIKQEIELLNFLGEQRLAKEKEIEMKRVEMASKYSGDIVAINEAADSQKADNTQKYALAQIQSGLQVFNTAANLIQQLMQLENIASQNRLSNLDNEYQRRVQEIEDNITNEEDRQAAIDALDAEFEARKKKLKRDAAKQQKQLAIFETLVGIPQAAFQAYKSALVIPPPAGPIVGGIMAAAATALGFKKLQMIRETPLPELAVGAYNVPSDMPVVIHQGETVIPKSFTESIASGEAVLGNPGSQMTRITVNLGSRTIYDDISRATRNGEIIVDARAVR